MQAIINRNKDNLPLILKIVTEMHAVKRVKRAVSTVENALITIWKRILPNPSWNSVSSLSIRLIFTHY